MSVIEPEVIPPKMHQHDPRWGEVRALVRKAMPGTIGELAKTAGYDEETVKDAIVWLVNKSLAREDRDEPGTVRWQRVLTATEIAESSATILDVVAPAAAMLGQADVAEVLQKSASAMRAIPPAIEGIKQAAKPAIDAFSDLYQTTKAKGIIRKRPPYKPAIKRR